MLVNIKRGDQKRSVSVSRATKLIAQGWSFDVNLAAEKIEKEYDCGCEDKTKVEAEQLVLDLEPAEEIIEEPIMATKKKRKGK
jgi:hypothetical protein